MFQLKGGIFARSMLQNFAAGPLARFREELDQRHHSSPSNRTDLAQRHLQEAERHAAGDDQTALAAACEEYAMARLALDEPPTATATRPTGRRRRRVVDREDRLYATCVHEAGHVVAMFLLLDNSSVDYAVVAEDGSGFVRWLKDNYETSPLTAKIQVAVAGWAAEHIFGYSSGTGLGGDLKNLEKMGVPCGDVEGGDYIWTEESRHLEYQRELIEPSLREYKYAILAIADELYAACPGPVSGERLANIWDDNRWRDPVWGYQTL